MNKNKQKNTRKLKTKKQKLPRGAISVPMYKSPRTVLPSEYDTTMVYSVYTQVTNTGAFLASAPFRSEAYDVDPSIGSTAMPGFAEFAQFYSRYRTLALEYKFNVSNREAFPVALIHGFSISTVTSGNLSIPYVGNPLFNMTMVGQTAGNSVKTVRNRATVVQIVGSSQPLYDDLYTGSTTSATLATAGTVYCHCGIVSRTALANTGGIDLAAEVSLKIRFYRPNFLLS